MSGENKSSLVIAENYIKNILPINSKPALLEEYQEYFNYDKQKIKSLTAEDCGIICLRLSQYALFLQRCENKNKALEKELISNINNIISNTINNYTGSWDLQRAQAIKDNTVASEINEDLKEVQKILFSLKDVTNYIKDISDKYKNLQYSKSRKT